MKLISGNFYEGQTVLVEIDGKQYRRKVFYYHAGHVLAIRVNSTLYFDYDFEIDIVRSL